MAIVWMLGVRTWDSVFYSDSLLDGLHGNWMFLWAGIIRELSPISAAHLFPLSKVKMPKGKIK